MTVSFDYIVQLIVVNKLSCDVSCECVTSSHNLIVAVYHFALIGHYKLSIQTALVG